MKIVIISGSSRSNSQSRKVSEVLANKIKKMESDVELVDLHEVQLPVYNDEKHEIWNKILPSLESADGFIAVVPEWNGAAAPAFPNLLTYASVGSKPFAHKPLIIVGISSGAGGAYPIAQLKMFGNKNNFAVHLPDQMRLRDVKSVFNAADPEEGNAADESMHQRAEYMLEILLAYAHKLKEIRTSGITRVDDFPNGN